MARDRMRLGGVAALMLLAGCAATRNVGWTSAGASYLELARLNGQTLSRLDATPVVNTPSRPGPRPPARLPAARARRLWCRGKSPAPFAPSLRILGRMMGDEP